MHIYTHKIFQTLDDIPRSLWESLWPHKVERYDFYQCVEKAKLKGFEIFYVILYANEKPILVAPMFIADFDIAIALEGPGRAFFLTIRKAWPKFMIFKTLFCGSPISEHGVIGLDPHNLQPETLMAFSSAIDAFSKQHKARMVMFKDFMDDGIQSIKTLYTQGDYFLANSMPNVSININFKTLDEYFASISHGTRKDIRRKMKKTESLGGVKITMTHDVQYLIDDIHRLYDNTFKTSNIASEYLTKEFFLNVSKRMPNEAKYFLYYVGNKLIGFNLCFHKNGILIDKFIGLDYTLSREYNLYFISLMHNIQWCIDNRIKEYHLSQNAYGIKVKLGGKLVPFTALIKYNNVVVNSIFKSMVKMMEAKVNDKPNESH